MEDSDTDSTTEDFATVTLYPDCGFQVDENFDCPGHQRFTTAYLSMIFVANIDSYAGAGCPGCKLVYTAIRQAAPELLNLIDYIHLYKGPLEAIYMKLKSPMPDEKISFVWEYKANESSDGGVPAHRFHGEHFAALPSIVQLVPGDTSSARSISFASRHIYICNNEHICIQHRSHANMPTRLLDIRDGSVRLMEVPNTDSTVPYACLSHCWGKEPAVMLRTTSSTLQAFKTSIHWASIPRTFKDAIIATRSLGIYFLWIDALCIIQDDPLDWQRQSASMADIYENAYLTIAAATSVDTNSGCFTSQDEVDIHAARTPLVTISFQDGTTRNMYAMRRLGHNAEDFSLLKRGWACQERLLSPRILYFAGKELIWECRETLECECDSGTLRNFQRANPRSVHGDQFSSWRDVLRDYSNSSLTYASDIFPALSGIAKAYEKIYEDTYVAGLWTKCLPKMLLWFFKTDSDNYNLNTYPWRAPSWSWASQDSTGSLNWLSYEQSIAEVHSVVCKPSGADPTGQLAFAYLTLTTKLIPGCLQRRETGGAPFYVLRISSGHCIFPNWHIPDNSTGYSGLSDPRLAAGTFSLDVIIAQIGNCTKWVDVKHTFCTQRTAMACTTSCLLLAKHPDDTVRWVRVGILVITDNDDLLALDDVYDPNEDMLTGLQYDRGKDEMFSASWELRGEKSRDTFRLFDEAPMQDITIW